MHTGSGSLHILKEKAVKGHLQNSPGFDAIVKQEVKMYDEADVRRLASQNIRVQYQVHTRDLVLNPT